MSSEVVGSASVVIRATTDGLAKDIETQVTKAVGSVNPSGPGTKLGQSLGVSFNKGFLDSISASISKSFTGVIKTVTTETKKIDAPLKETASTSEKVFSGMSGVISKAFSGLSGQLSKNFSGVGDEAKKVGNTIEKDLAGSFTKLGDISKKGFSGIESSVGSLEGHLKSAFSRIALAAGAAFSFQQAKQFLSDAIELGSKLQKQSEANSVLFGTSDKAVVAFSKSTAASLGITETQALAATQSFGALLRGLQVGQAPAAAMSTRLVQLAGDLANFKHIDVDTVTKALQTGLTGSTRGLKTLGISIDANAIKQEALNEGLIKTDEKVTLAAKSQAIYALILKQTTLEQGSFAKTSGDLANQQAILTAELANVKAEIGQGLLPAATSLTTLLAQKLLPGVLLLVNGLSGPLGSALSTIGTLIEDTVGKLSDNQVFAQIAITINDLVQQFASLSPLIAEFATTIIPLLLRAGQSIGSIFLERLGIVLPILTDLVNTLGPPLLAILSSLDNAVEALAPSFRVFSDAIISLSPTISQLATDIVGLIQVAAVPLSEIIQKLGPILVGVAVPLLSVVSALINGLGPVLISLIPVIGNIVSAIGDSLAGALATLASVFVTLIPILGTAFTDILTALTPLIPVLISLVAEILPIFASLLESIAPILPVLATAFTEILTAVRPLVGILANQLVKILQSLLPVIPLLVDAFVQLVQPLATSLAPLIPQIALAFIQVVDAVLPLVPAILQLLPPLIQGLLPILPDLVISLQIFANVITILAPIILLLVNAFAKLVTFISPMLPIIVPLVLLFAVFSNPVIAVVGALILLVEVFKLLTPKFIEIGKEAVKLFDNFLLGIKVIKQFFTNFKNNFENGLEIVENFITGLGPKLKNGISEGFEKAKSSAITGLENLGKAILKGIKAIPGLISDATRVIFKGIIIEAIGVPIVIGVLLFRLGKVIREEIKKLPGQITKAASNLWDGFKDTVRSLADFVVTEVPKVFDSVVGFISGLPGRIATAAIGLWDGFSDATNTALDTASEFITTQFDKFVGFISNLPGKIATAAIGMWDGFKNITSDAMGAVVGFVAGLPDRLTGLFNDLIKSGESLGSSLIEGVKNAIIGAGDVAADFAKTIGNAIIDFINGAIIGNINDALHISFDVPVIGKINIDPPDIPSLPRLANGGIALARPGGTTATLAEAGSNEAIVPLNGQGAGFMAQALELALRNISGGGKPDGAASLAGLNTTPLVGTMIVNGADPVATSQEVVKRLDRVRRTPPRR